jgi:hypothetical protein
MGATRLIYTDATTAEAISVFKSLGYLETSDGGCFKNPGSPLRIYSVWGKADYYPELLKQLPFAPRIQVHLKCKEECSVLNEILQASVQGFMGLSGGTRIIVYNADTGVELTPALLKG